MTVQLDGITKDDFQIWKHHPVSKLYLKYLEDYAALLGREFLDRWLAGHITTDTEKELRGRILTLTDLVELQFDSIKKFYQTEEENEGTATQVIAET